MPGTDMQMPEWVVCTGGEGNLHHEGVPEKRLRNFPVNSVGLVRSRNAGSVVVWLIGEDKTWTVPADAVQLVDVYKTGDKFEKKICNICHRLLSVSNFARNQTNKHGIIRRPSCLKCRTDIDKRAPKSRQAKMMEKNKPAAGSDFKCPICQKRSIVNVTAKIVADHDHHTGNIRDFICDSCNTGLGRFKNGENLLRNALAYLKERDTLSMGDE